MVSLRRAAAAEELRTDLRAVRLGEDGDHPTAGRPRTAASDGPGLDGGIG